MRSSSTNFTLISAGTPPSPSTIVCTTRSPLSATTAASASDAYPSRRCSTRSRRAIASPCTSGSAIHSVALSPCTSRCVGTSGSTE